jgi:hypothetical protein
MNHVGMKPVGYLVASLVFLVAVPLAPLALEQMAETSVKNSTWAITAAIYCVCVGAASREGSVFACGVLASIFGSAMYGIVEASPKTVGHPEVASVSIGLIIIFSVVLLIERFIIHVLEKKPFFEFS